MHVLLKYVALASNSLLNRILHNLDKLRFTIRSSRSEPTELHYGTEHRVVDANELSSTMLHSSRSEPTELHDATE